MEGVRERGGQASQVEELILHSNPITLLCSEENVKVELALLSKMGGPEFMSVSGGVTSIIHEYPDVAVFPAVSVARNSNT